MVLSSHSLQAALWPVTDRYACGLRHVGSCFTTCDRQLVCMWLITSIHSLCRGIVRRVRCTLQLYICLRHGSLTQEHFHHKESICHFIVTPSARRRYAVLHTHLVIMFADNQSTTAEINTGSRPVCHESTSKDFCILISITA